MRKREREREEKVQGFDLCQNGIFSKNHQHHRQMTVQEIAKAFIC